MTRDDLPWVTLVTPVYNQGEYLAQTIESVLALDYPNLEYIVLDDGSTDDTPAVLSRYEGRIRYESHANMGQAATLNKGWAMGRGQYIGYLSADDLLLPHAITLLVERLEAAPEFGVAYGDFEIIDSLGNYVKTLQAEDYSHERLACDLICQPGVGALFRKSLFESEGGWSVELRQVPDYEFWLRMAAAAPFIRVPEVLGAYRIHEGSASFRVMTPERATEVVRVVDAYWNGKDTPSARRARSNALIFASKNHAQSMRLKESWACLFAALRLNPGASLRLGTWRSMAAGTFRRLMYGKRVKP